MAKAPLALTCAEPNPTDPGENGCKRSLLVDGRGVPLLIVASGANVHDVKLLAATLDQVVRHGRHTVRKHPSISAPTQDIRQHLPGKRRRSVNTGLTSNNGEKKRMRSARIQATGLVGG